MNPLSILTPRGGTFFVLGLGTVLAGIALGYPDVTRIGIVLTLLPILALALARGGAPRIAVSRTVSPHRLQPDEPGVVEASFRNVGTRRTPLYLAQETIDVHLGDQPRFVLHPLDRGQARRLRYQVRSSTRGAYRLGPLSLRQRDPFGLTYVAVRLSSTTEVVVLPGSSTSRDGAPSLRDGAVRVSSRRWSRSTARTTSASATTATETSCDGFIGQRPPTGVSSWCVRRIGPLGGGPC